MCAKALFGNSIYSALSKLKVVTETRENQWQHLQYSNIWDLASTWCSSRVRVKRIQTALSRYFHTYKHTTKRKTEVHTIE